MWAAGAKLMLVGNCVRAHVYIISFISKCIIIGPPSHIPIFFSLSTSFPSFFKNNSRIYKICLLIITVCGPFINVRSVCLQLLF